MRRRTVDLRIFLATVIVLGVALTFVSLAFAGVYNTPVQHVVEFRGVATARVVNYSKVVSQQNLTETGIPAGALLGFTWDYSGPGGEVAILASSGGGPSGGWAVVCESGLDTLGSCAWTATGQPFTVSISGSMSAPPVTGPNYTAYVGIQGWYTYSTSPPSWP